MANDLVERVHAVIEDRLFPIFGAGPYEDTARLVAEAIGSETEGWQPIETAPRGPRIVVFESDGLGCCVASAGWQNTTPDKVEWQVVNDITCHPTHWRPLPEPPSALSGESEDGRG